MHRSFLLIAALAVCAAKSHGRIANDKPAQPRPAAEKKARTRHVLFRTDSPRLFAPSPARPREPAPQRSGKKSKSVAPLPSRSPERPIPPPTGTRSTQPAVAPGRDIEFQPTTFTPYDAYLGPTRSVLARVDSRNASMVTACELMREGRSFRYLATDPYRAQSPAVTEARHAGDCKSKALWLYDHLGDPGAFYVIGKLERRSRASHAWVYWRHNGRWWILDPTDRSTPIAADSVPAGRYVPYYSYSRAGSFRHGATRLLLASAAIPAVPAVAVRSRPLEVRETRR